jgi:hypothetical protein
MSDYIKAANTPVSAMHLQEPNSGNAESSAKPEKGITVETQPMTGHSFKGGANGITKIDEAEEPV